MSRTYELIMELSKKTLKSYARKANRWLDQEPNAWSDMDKAIKRIENVKKAKDKAKLAKEELVIETLPATATASDYIKDFVHSKNKMFKGDSTKQRIKRALGAYYHSHPSKSNK